MSRRSKKAKLIEEGWAEYDEPEVYPSVGPGSRFLCSAGKKFMSLYQWEQSQHLIFPAKKIQVCSCNMCQCLRKDCSYVRAREECLLNNNPDQPQMPGRIYDRSDIGFCACTPCRDYAQRHCVCPGCVNRSMCFSNYTDLFSSRYICECEKCMAAFEECDCGHCSIFFVKDILMCHTCEPDDLNDYRRCVFCGPRFFQAFSDEELRILRRTYRSTSSNRTTMNLPLLALKIMIEQFPEFDPKYI